MYITVAASHEGYVACQIPDPEDVFDYVVTSSTRFTRFEDALVEAKAWARFDGLDVRIFSAH